MFISLHFFCVALSIRSLIRPHREMYRKWIHFPCSLDLSLDNNILGHYYKRLKNGPEYIVKTRSRNSFLWPVNGSWLDFVLCCPAIKNHSQGQRKGKWNVHELSSGLISFLIRARWVAQGHAALLFGPLLFSLYVDGPKKSCFTFLVFFISIGPTASPRDQMQWKDHSLTLWMGHSLVLFPLYYGPSMGWEN